MLKRLNVVLKTLPLTSINTSPLINLEYSNSVRYYYSLSNKYDHRGRDDDGVVVIRTASTRLPIGRLQDEEDTQTTTQTVSSSFQRSNLIAIENKLNCQVSNPTDSKNVKFKDAWVRTAASTVPNSSQIAYNLGQSRIYLRMCHRRPNLVYNKRLDLQKHLYSTTANDVYLTSKDPNLRKYLEKLKLKYEDVKKNSSQEEYKLRHLMELLHKMESAESEERDLTSMSLDQSSLELAALARQDLPVAREAVEQLATQIVASLASLHTGPPTGGRPVTLEISAGVGGLEAMLFTQELWTMYQGYATRRGWSFLKQDYLESELGGLRRGVAFLSSPGNEDVYRLLKYEGGIHRVQRVPRTEKAGRLHTSTVAVVVMLVPGEVDIKVLQKDLKVDTMRSSGAGGQSVNTADSAVRITHLPTGCVVECQEERSQHRNMKKAMQKLRSLLYQREQEKELTASTSRRRLQIGTRGRSEKIRTYNFSQDRVTDHRINTSVHNAPGVMAGGDCLHALLDKLQTFAERETLELLLESDPLKT